MGSVPTTPVRHPRLETTQMKAGEKARVALVWRGQPQTRERLQPLYSELSRCGIVTEWAVYSEETQEKTREDLQRCDAALIWVDPISDGRDRTKFDAMLRDASLEGLWVSAHPDVIQKMGTKDVLYTTRHLGWNPDIGIYRTFAELEDQFPARLASSGTRVLKQRRGNGGVGIWKVQCMRDASQIVTLESRVTVEEARPGAPREELRVAELLQRLEPLLSTGALLDQRFEPRAAEGMIRCYLVHDRVAGFSTQAPRGDGSFGHAREKTMYEASEPALRSLKAILEQDWVPGLLRTLAIDARSLPVIWDADFLLGPKTAAGENTYILCEINVSCVSPFPEFAVPQIARAVSSRVLP